MLAKYNSLCANKSQIVRNYGGTTSLFHHTKNEKEEEDFLSIQTDIEMVCDNFVQQHVTFKEFKALVA